MLTLLITLACSPSSDDTGPGDGGSDADVPDCEDGSRDGSADGSDDEETDDGTRFTVRVPDDYEETEAHPLVVVYAPAGGDPELTEQFTGLTSDLTDAGYLVAYADHQSPTSADVFTDLGSIPSLIAEQWCVDEGRVHFTGHSDGGSIASVLAVYPEYASIPPASIAPSAAGVDGSWLGAQTCPADPLPVMVMHSDGDTLFPGFGAEAAEWWADCNGCSVSPSDPDGDGCVTYENCDDDVATIYCEGSGSHGTWPRLNDAMVTFFDG